MNPVSVWWHPYCRRWPAVTRYGQAKRHGSMLGGPRKAIAHKTQTAGGNPDALYKNTGYWPHFTISPDNAWQHLPVNVHGYALANKNGGVETNRAGLYVVQVELIGFSGETMHSRTADRFIAVARWLRDIHRIPWLWPSGRPPKKGERDGREILDWNHDGWYGHSQVPENSHWDPAFTDLEWWVLGHGMAQ